MPGLNEQKLPLWPSHCERIIVKEPRVIQTTSAENAYLQVISGKAYALHDGRRHLLTTRTVVAMAREIRVDHLSPPSERFMAWLDFRI